MKKIVIVFALLLLSTGVFAPRAEARGDGIAAVLGVMAGVAAAAAEANAQAQAQAAIIAAAQAQQQAQVNAAS
jgi:hypothetical protein